MTNADRNRDEKSGFAPQPKQPPGETTAMSPRPDHGEESYEGSGKLSGKVALIDETLATFAKLDVRVKFPVDEASRQLKPCD